MTIAAPLADVTASSCEKKATAVAGINAFESATYVNGDHLGAGDWAYVKVIGWGAGLLGKISDECIYGDGPWGPGTRDFVKNSALTPMRETAPQQAVPQRAAPPEAARAQPTPA